LNVILRLPGRTLPKESNVKAWNALRDEFYFALLGEKGPVPKYKAFNVVVSATGVRAAQEELRNVLPLLKHHTPHSQAPRLTLSAQGLYIGLDGEGRFFYEYLPVDFDNETAFPTMVYQVLVYLLERCQITLKDLLRCANPSCASLFAPLRRAHVGTRSFCSKRCANLIAVQEFRKKHKKALQKKEVQRSRKRYEAKTGGRIRHRT
jgi:hypothetical protein